MAQPRTVVGGHQRLILMLHTFQICFCEEMICAIQGLKLQREVVFVTRYTGELLARRGRHDHGFLRWVRLGFRMKYCLPNLLRRFCGRIVAQVGSDESSRSRDHVALSTSGFAEE